MSNMLTLRPVVELPRPAATRAWPTRIPPPGGWLTLHAGCPAEEVETFLASLAADVDVEPPGGRDQVVDALLGEDLLLVAGGLRLDDTATGASLSPGCCAGLEDWREWTSALDGGAPWLGHDPRPEIEVRGGLLRAWQHGGPRRRGPYIDLTRADLAELLASAQADLVGFLALIDQWARDGGLGARGAALVAAVDRDFEITAPLAFAGGGPERHYLT